MSTTVTCIGCGAEVPDSNGATHEYMLSAPGCWKLYGEVLAREYSNMAYMRVHQLTVDAYAVQHPGSDDRRAVQSVALHLMSLYQTQHLHNAPHEANQFLQRAARAKDALTFVRLEPPTSLGHITILDVHAANSANAHQQVVRAWAQSAWEAWEVHHAQIEAWVQQVMTT